MVRILTVGAFVDALGAMAASLGPGERRIVALAGPPGAGKSTLTERIAEAVGPPLAALAMDGYHYDDRVLDAWGVRARKGAPDTFDVGGLAAMLHRLSENAEERVAVPVFDRSLEIARAGAALIERTARVVLVEGNYLLLRAPPWDRLQPLFDATAMIRVAEATLADRLARRWESHGLDAAAVRQKVHGNDLPNGRMVYANSVQADYEIQA